MKKTIIITALGLLSLNSIAASNSSDQKTINALIPVFSEVIGMKIPRDFNVVNQGTSKDGFIFEAVPKGQTVDNWKQMITITGQRNMAMAPGFSIDNVATLFGKGYRNNCPDSFSTKNIDKYEKIDEHNNVAVLYRCGNESKDGKTYSETNLVNFIQGKKDFYTIQYAERNKSAKEITTDDITYYSAKEKNLVPSFFCDHTEGQMPLKSCEPKLK